MAVYVALLYSIVLGSGRRVVMADLKAMAERLGFRNARTLVATGNLIFECQPRSIASIEAQLEAGFAATFGKQVDIIVRDADTWLRLAGGNPFLDGIGSEVIVRVMRQPLEPQTLDALGKYRQDERMAIVDGDLWIDFGLKASETKLLPALTTKRLGVGTMRNWNTVRGLAEMIGR
ncbi:MULTISPECIES: DUF1697 domain-containing protein [unclassified Rhizobium]|jgi:uncharacterized protein (DUF1697 family)|uniref:DUF1697 domain-containing protein n=1 Tax=unclassified Rhizobium TaxID=2613769 RepID=UPI000648346B|nr:MULTISPECIES: DUF1697 domain-containing protein [unclassified Rhizobium]MBN8951980.1 DUF1697 domain-containing protein [Rhizobium tropici]OJY78059.1 MAG: hypothetical protein BGP09_13500 [Rhizobium sp. 60-20]RKD56615.1 uncharacterized protein (DUF1697 family) [Rhizobium sp. WW_1]